MELYYSVYNIEWFMVCILKSFGLINSKFIKFSGSKLTNRLIIHPSPQQEKQTFF